MGTWRSDLDLSSVLGIQHIKNQPKVGVLNGFTYRTFHLNSLHHLVHLKHSHFRLLVMGFHTKHTHTDTIWIHSLLSHWKNCYVLKWRFLDTVLATWLMWPLFWGERAAFKALSSPNMQGHCNGRHVLRYIGGGVWRLCWGSLSEYLPCRQAWHSAQSLFQLTPSA